MNPQSAQDRIMTLGIPEEDAWLIVLLHKTRETSTDSYDQQMAEKVLTSKIAPYGQTEEAAA